MTSQPGLDLCGGVNYTIWASEKRRDVVRMLEPNRQRIRFQEDFVQGRVDRDREQRNEINQLKDQRNQNTNTIKNQLNDEVQREVEIQTRFVWKFSRRLILFSRFCPPTKLTSLLKNQSQQQL